MAELIIDRLALDVGALSPPDARRLSSLIGNRLAEALPQARQNLRLESVRIDLHDKPDAPIDELAVRIADEILGQLRLTT